MRIGDTRPRALHTDKQTANGPGVSVNDGFQTVVEFGGGMKFLLTPFLHFNHCGLSCIHSS